MTESGSVLIKSILASLSEEEIMELAKPTDEVSLDNLPTIRKILGLEKEHEGDS